MHRLRELRFLLLLLLAAPLGLGPVGCSSEVSEAPACGKPGDAGNSRGVGQYCKTNADCTHPTASRCTAEHAERMHVCTAGCDAEGDVEAQCGEDAICQCGPSGGCGCLPAECVPS